jgi:hypothetical protein
MSRAGAFRHTPDIDSLTPFPAPWSFPEDGENKKPKWEKWTSRPFPKDQWRFKPLKWDPFPHRKNPGVKAVVGKHQLVITSTHAKNLAAGRTRIQIDGGTYIARLRLRKGEEITGSTNVYVAKVLSPKEAGTSYPVYILRIQPDQPKDPGNKASGAAKEQYISDLMKWQYRFDRANYWENVRLVKQWRAEQQDLHRQRYEKALAKAKAKWYKDQSAARIAYEREVTEAQMKYKQALREYQISKIGSYYGNKYFSLYGSYFD